MAAMSLAFFSGIMIGITHYGAGPAPIHFNAAYMDQKTWWLLGLVISFVNIGNFLTAGFGWWKYLGLW